MSPPGHPDVAPLVWWLLGGQDGRHPLLGDVAAAREMRGHETLQCGPSSRVVWTATFSGTTLRAKACLSVGTDLVSGVLRTQGPPSVKAQNGGTWVRK